MGSPYDYRLLWVAMAIPFYNLLPTLRFSYLPDIDPAYLQATQALCFTSYLSVILTAIVIYAISKKYHNASNASALIVALLSFFAGSYMERSLVDPFAALIISILLIVIDKPLFFSVLILTAVGINEKILIVLTPLLAFRVLNAYTKGEKPAYLIQFVSAPCNHL